MCGRVLVCESGGVCAKESGCKCDRKRECLWVCARERVCVLVCVCVCVCGLVGI